MSSYHSHYDEKHLIGNLLSDQDESFLLHSSGSSQSSAREYSAATVASSNAVGAVGSEFNSAWPEPPPPYTPSTWIAPPPGLPVSTWREAPHNLRVENVVDDWSSFLAKKTPSYNSLMPRSSTQSAPVTAPVHNDSMPFSYRDALNRGTWQSMANSRHGSSSSMMKEGEKNGEGARMKSSNEEVNQDTKSSKGTSSESRDSFQQITRKKGQQKVQNVNGEGSVRQKSRARTVNVAELLERSPIEDNSRFTILDNLPTRRNTSSFSDDDGSAESRVDRTPMHSTLTKNERKSNVTSGSSGTKKRWTRRDEKNKTIGIMEHLSLLIAMIRLALTHVRTLASSIFSYIYDLVVDFVLNLVAIIRYGVDRARVEARVKMHEVRGKATQWWNKKKEEQPFGLVHNIRMPETAEDALDRLIHARGQDAYSVLGLRADETDEVIKSYYKKQALLVHPDKNKKDGAAEAFQILSKAFEVVSTPDKRRIYDAERMMTGPLRKEFTDLYRVLQVKVEETRNRMDCNCGETHVRVACKLPQQAARYCSKCDTRHAAKNLDLWAESRFLGSMWVYYTCVNGVVYDVSAWANCSFNQLKHIRADQHNVQYRMANVKKEKEQRQTADRYQRLLSEGTDKTTPIHLNGGSNQASLQPVAREEDRPRKARRAKKK